MLIVVHGICCVYVREEQKDTEHTYLSIWLMETRLDCLLPSAHSLSLVGILDNIADTCDTCEQSWSLEVFLNFSIIKKDFLHFLSSLFDWEWAF